MNSHVLFFEDNTKGKKNWLFLTIFLIICFVGWTLSFILSLVIPIPDKGVTNGFNDNLVDNIMIIILLSLIFCLIIFLFIFRFKSSRFKYSITITPKELQFAIPQKNKTLFYIDEIKSYEIIQKIGNCAILKVIFNDIEIVIRTRKHDELTNILDYLIETKFDSLSKVEL